MTKLSESQLYALRELMRSPGHPYEVATRATIRSLERRGLVRRVATAHGVTMPLTDAGLLALAALEP